MINNSIFNNNNLKLVFYFSIGTFIITKCYHKYCNYKVFNRLDTLFPKKKKWEKDLDIYSVSMPLFYTTYPKRNKCILFIAGYKDIPFVWDDIIKYFKTDFNDFYAPRTFGFGRSFFQDSDPKDWIITYLEAIHVLQEQYYEIDIIGFSTGAVIALYLTQFEYKCKINNLFLCAPFILYKPSFSYYLFFESIFSWILNPIYRYTLNYHDKKINSDKYTTCRDIIYEKNSKEDFYESLGILSLENKLINFIKFRPEVINVNNIVILYPNDDQIIGDIYEQKEILSKIWKKKIDLITIPNYNNKKVFYNSILNYQKNELPKYCGHVMFKEHPLIVENIYDIIAKYL